MQLAVVVITPWGKGCPWGWTAAGWDMYCTPIAAGATELPMMPPKLVLAALRPPLLVLVLFSMYLIRSAVDQVGVSTSLVSMTWMCMAPFSTCRQDSWLLWCRQHAGLLNWT